MPSSVSTLISRRGAARIAVALVPRTCFIGTSTPTAVTERTVSDGTVKLCLLLAFSLKGEDIANRPVGRRGHAYFLTKLNDASTEPIHLERSTALKIMMHRRRHIFGKT